MGKMRSCDKRAIVGVPAVAHEAADDTTTLSAALGRCTSGVRLLTVSCHP